MTAAGSEDEWAQHAEQFVEGHYGSLRGRVRTHVVDEHLAGHLPPPPLSIVDIGGGAGHQGIPLARRGYDVTIVDPSDSMLGRARNRIAAEVPDVGQRIELVHCAGEEAPSVLGRQFGAVLCHGVLLYLDDPSVLLDALCELVEVDGLLSILTKNAATLAIRPALNGDWVGALAAFDDDREVNALGVDTRAETVEQLQHSLVERGVDPVAWYGVRLFTEGWRADRADDPEDLVLAVELEASRRDPYRQLSRLFHLVGVRRV